MTDHSGLEAELRESQPAGVRDGRLAEVPAQAPAQGMGEQDG